MYWICLVLRTKITSFTIFHFTFTIKVNFFCLEEDLKTNSIISAWLLGKVVLLSQTTSSLEACPTQTGVLWPPNKYWILQLQILNLSIRNTESFNYKYWIFQLQILNLSITNIESFNYKYWILPLQILNLSITNTNSFNYKYWILQLQMLNVSITNTESDMTTICHIVAFPKTLFRYSC